MGRGKKIKQRKMKKGKSPKKPIKQKSKGKR